MADLEDINVALPTEMVSVMEAAVRSGEYTTTGDVVRDALRDWKLKRRPGDVGELRRLVEQGVASGASVEAEPASTRLRQKYEARVPKPE